MEVVQLFQGYGGTVRRLLPVYFLPETPKFPAIHLIK